MGISSSNMQHERTEMRAEMREVLQRERTEMRTETVEVLQRKLAAMRAEMKAEILRVMACAQANVQRVLDEKSAVEAELASVKEAVATLAERYSKILFPAGMNPGLLWATPESLALLWERHALTTNGGVPCRAASWSTI
jgi:hypothetical protein